MPKTPNILLMLFSSLALATAHPAMAAQKKPVPSGTVTISQAQAGYIVAAQYGGGTLRYRGRSYAFKIGGLGLGGLGASSLTASGTVYNLSALHNFPGRYIAARTGLVVLDKSAGKVWLKNQHGVYIALRAKRKGLMLSTGLDRVVISMK
ncbi:hypothetical protein GCM10007874_46990 [Labrys miyagiensis]|uniref:DUF1134 domain-containing protein n=1 Tax=Labrys miyagiensis TaxID=346912 RepID=A0ABQ6CQ05_9HYPH|nr:hypothetical protein [Labrys miyagiensis]GLS21682.1 hypothetical protein GCM10007874_46990 [Labrys miyagiensis]